MDLCIAKRPSCGVLWGVKKVERGGGGAGRSRTVVVSCKGETAVRSPGPGAKERRRLKSQELKKIRQQEHQSKYPGWARIIEDACKNDAELREIVGDSLGNPEEMQKRIEERVRRKGRDILQPKSGSAVPMPVKFRDFITAKSYIWLELYGAPSDEDVEIIGSVIRAWYMLGRLGAFNSFNLQLYRTPINVGLSYNHEVAEAPLPSCFHEIGDLEFQDNLGRFWFDLGTADSLALDILINALAGTSLEHVGIKCLIFGGKCLGDWEEGLTSKEDGYKSFKI